MSAYCSAGVRNAVDVTDAVRSQRSARSAARRRGLPPLPSPPVQVADGGLELLRHLRQLLPEFARAHAQYARAQRRELDERVGRNDAHGVVFSDLIGELFHVGVRRLALPRKTTCRPLRSNFSP